MFEHLNVRINDRNIDYRKAEHIDKKDRQILRNLAQRLAEVAARPEQEAKKKLWIEHNALKPTRPPIFCDPENGWNEIITDDQIQCRNEVARYWEATLRKELFWGERMGDDKVIEPNLDVHYIYTESGWGLKETRIGGELDVYRLDGGSYRWEAPLKDYMDMDKLHFPKIEVDYELTKKILEIAQEIFGDILNIRLKTIWWWSVGLTDDLAYLRGLENILYDVYDHPHELHKLMKFLYEGTKAKLEFLEANGLLSLNNDGTFVGSGGYGWTEELPQKDFDGRVRLIDMWGMAESQVTVGLSPQMFEEYVFRYQLPLLEKFGLNCYGCCEPLNARWEIIKQIPRLRRVSVSPWADIEDMAEKLQDKYIFSWKPHPGVLATPNIDEEQIRKDIRRTLEVTRGCILEICMKDNHTLGNNPENVVKWCQIVKEEIEKVY